MLTYGCLAREEEYGKYLRSEDALMKLLSFVSLVCVLISVFGIFSLVTLSCEQRQKEIAIRKVNGAQIRHILQMFFREYLLLLVIAAVIAFPMGYVVMRQWLETYVRQTVINGWVYVGIFRCSGSYYFTLHHLAHMESRPTESCGSYQK